MKPTTIFCSGTYEQYHEGELPDPFRKVESNYMRDAVAAKKSLETISNSMCLAKWLQVSIHLTTGRTQSCYHPPTHKIPLAEISKNPGALHNTKYKIEQRKQMLEGKRPSECSYCWKMEDLGHLSDRHYRSGEFWSAPFFEEVKNSKLGENISPRYVEVNFNHACNLKCSYCSPHISSSWLEEVKKFGPYPTLQKHNSLSWVEDQDLMPYLQSEENPYAAAFWNWWPQIYPELKVFRMTGGEPLMDINTFKVLDYIIAHPNRDLQVSVTSNFSAKAELINRFIERVKIISDGHYANKFQLFVSCDSTGNQAEYIRHGLNYDYFLNNVDQFLTNVQTGVVTFIITMNNLSCPGFRNLLRDILELRKKHSRFFQRIWFDTPVLRYPSWQSLQILPHEFSDYLEAGIEFMKDNPMTMQSTASRLHGFHDYEVAKVRRVIDWMKEGGNESSELKKNKINFYRFFSEHDKRRSTNFLETFPEYKNFWQECQDLNG